VQRPDRHCMGASTSTTGHRRGGFGRSDETFLAEVGGVGEPGGVAGDHPDTSTSLTSRRQLFYPSVIEQRR